MDWVKKARSHVERILNKLPDDMTGAARETLLEAACRELEKIPVPFVGTLLAKTLESAVGGDVARAPTLEDVLSLLKDMVSSDDEFRYGLEALGANLQRLDEQIDAVLTAVIETRQTLSEPRALISDPELDIRYPVFDNELRFGLMNIGGGAIKVPEIELQVKGFETEIRIDYTMPAAPPSFLALEVTLSPSVDRYPLFDLNHEPFRRFGAYSEGAEDVIIKMRSVANVKYYLRFRVPYQEVGTNGAGELYYPQLGQPPAEVPFWFAPGWNRDITAENILERGKVLDSIAATFKALTGILAVSEPTDEPDEIDLINKKILETDIPFGLGDFPGLPEMLTVFTPCVAQMAQLENRPELFEVLLHLTHQLLRFVPINRFAEPPPSDVLCELVGRADRVGEVTALFEETDGTKRAAMLRNLLTVT